jgi:hypothetical protein
VPFDHCGPVVFAASQARGAAISSASTEVQLEGRKENSITLDRSWSSHRGCASRLPAASPRAGSSSAASAS